MPHEEFGQPTARLEYSSRINRRGPVAIATELLDRNIHTARRQFGRSVRTLDEAHDRLAASVANAEQTLADSDPFTDETTWNEHFRLMGRAAFAAQLVVITPTFLHGDNQQRSDLTNSARSTGATVLSKAMEAYRDPSATDEDQKELKGVINEYSVISLANLRSAGRGKWLSVPSSQWMDTKRNVDSAFYEVLAQGGFRRTNTQAKSSQRPKSFVTGEEMPPPSDSVAYIYASDFRNKGDYQEGSDPFPITSILLRDFQGETIADLEYRQVSVAIQGILTRIRNQRNDRNTQLFLP